MMLIPMRKAKSHGWVVNKILDVARVIYRTKEWVFDIPYTYNTTRGWTR